MKIVANPNSTGSDAVPIVTATPINSIRSEPSKSSVSPKQSNISAVDLAAIAFLRQFRVLLGAARLYQRNHPRLMEVLTFVEHQLRAALTLHSPLVFAIERDGFVFPRNDGSPAEALNDPRGELRMLADEMLRSGICSILFSSQINLGELDLIAHEISQVPRSTAPGDTATRKAWDAWLREQKIAGIRLNIPTERRDSVLLGSLVSAVLAYDQIPQQSLTSRAAAAQPSASFDQMAATLRAVAKLAPPRDPELVASAEDTARWIHSVVSRSDSAAISLIVYGVSHVKPREGETLEIYLERLADGLMLSYLKQEFDANRASPPEVMPLLSRLERVRSDALNLGSGQTWNMPHDEQRMTALCEKFWLSLPARTKAKALRGSFCWSLPSGVIAHFLEPLAKAAKNKKAEAAGREGRAVLMAYAHCLESEEGKIRRSVAAGLTDLASQIERLWPHASIPEFGRGIVQALLLEVSPGTAGLLSAVVENLARVSLLRQDYAEFERILETLERAPRDDDHAHIATLLGRILSDEQWLYLINEGLASRPLHPVIPRLLRRCPDRLIDRLGLLLTDPAGLNSLPAMVRLVHGVGEPVLGALELRLYEPRRQRVACAIHVLASADPKRLAAALPRALASWEWSLQDLAVSELARWTNPPVVAATSQAFHRTLGEAHAMVVPSMIDQLGSSNEVAAIPTLLQVAAGEHLTLRDIYFRIKAVEALGRMRASEAASLLVQITRGRTGLAHDEPAALREAAEESLGLLENHPSSARSRKTENAIYKSNLGHARSRRYLRVNLEDAIKAVIGGVRGGAARVRTISLGGGFIETDCQLVLGESRKLEIRAGLRTIEATAVVRNVGNHGIGVEFVHMKAPDRERLRRLVMQHLG